MCGRYRVYIIEDCCGDQSVEVGGQWTVAGTLYDTSHCQVHSSILAAYHGYNCEVLDSGSLLDMLADLHSAKRKQFCNVCQ